MIGLISGLFIGYGLFGGYINQMVNYLTRDLQYMFPFLPSPIISFSLKALILVSLYHVVKAFASLMGD